MDISTGNLNLTKNNKAKEMTFNISITLLVVTNGANVVAANYVIKKITIKRIAESEKEKELLIVNLYLALRTRIQNSINKNLFCCKIKVTFKSTARLSNFFRFKDKVLFNLRY